MIVILIKSSLNNKVTEHYISHTLYILKICYFFVLYYLLIYNLYDLKYLLNIQNKYLYFHIKNVVMPCHIKYKNKLWQTRQYH